jgi:hypothetical protein
MGYLIMTDKEILDTVYRWINQSLQRDEPDHFHKRRLKDCKDFIEQGWQSQSAETPPDTGGEWPHALSESDWSKAIEASDQKINAALYHDEATKALRRQEAAKRRGWEIDPDGYVKKLD